MSPEFKASRLNPLPLMLIIAALAVGCDADPQPRGSAPPTQRPRPEDTSSEERPPLDASLGQEGGVIEPEARCGDGVVDPGELCDGACPQICDDGLACTQDRLEGSADRCDARCAFTPIEACASGDGCCPAGCDANDDLDCEPGCGNGVVEPPEVCDGECPIQEDCDDGDACTRDRLEGSARGCDARCVSIPIEVCASGDGCCPVGCDANVDDDCAPECGNGVVEGDEICDGRCPPPESCDDGLACTEGSVIGDPERCDAACAYELVQVCRGGDGCCPAGCDANTDEDCSETCGNGALEAREVCDGDCPTPEDCERAGACFIAQLIGSAEACSAQCIQTPISACHSGDGCCPSSCNANTDADCSAVCGNGVLEAGEGCDDGDRVGQDRCSPGCEVEPLAPPGVEL